MFLHESRPFFNTFISDSLSFANVLLWSLYPCSSMNISKYIFFGSPSLVPTCSHSVELRVFIFCLEAFWSRTPVPIVIICPVCPLMSLCTACAESVIVSMCSRSSAPTVRTSSCVCLIQHIILINLCQSSLFGSWTLVIWNVFVNSISGLLLFIAQATFITYFKNISALSLLSFVAFSFTLNNHFACGVLYVLLSFMPISSSKSLIIFLI